MGWRGWGHVPESGSLSSMAAAKSVRDAVESAHRIVVKIGSSSLTSPEGGVDPARVQRLADAVAQRRASGAEVVLVSSGAIAAGLPALGLTRRPSDLASQQAAASVGMGKLMALYSQAFETHGITVGQVLLTAEDVTRRGHYRNAQSTLNRLLDLHVVPIVNENDTVATNEIRFGDNDRLAALAAHLVRADVLVLLSDIDGLYDGPPSREGSRLIPEVRSAADLEQVEVGGTGSAVGLGGMTTKIEAARIATGEGIPVVLCRADAVQAALAGEIVGTYFHPQSRRRSTRLLWLAHASAPQGRVIVDAGAVTALVDSGKSLLPAGITAVEGEFSAGDPVDIVGPSGSVIARGLVSYDSVELPALLGRSTRELGSEFGSEYTREVVHRDDLVLLGQ